MKFDARARREFLISLRDGLLVGVLLFAAWCVGMTLLAGDVEARIADSLGPLVTRHVLLAAAVCFLTAIAVAALRIHGFVLARLHPSKRELLAKFTENLPGMLYQYRQYPTGHGSVTFCTDAIRWIYEMDPESARADGTKILDLLHPDDHDRIWKSLVHAHLHLGPWKEEYRVVLPKAGICWRYAHAHVERLPDGGTLWHGFIIDITREKTAGLELAIARRKAEAASLAKSRFLAMLSHDIRTPMNGIVGFATLLKDTPLEESQREHVLAIEQSADSLLCLINDILDLSKIEAGRLSIHPRPFPLVPLLREVVGILRPHAQAKGISLELDLHPLLPGSIETDRTRLSQILVNLVGNAVKFTDRGGVTVRAACVRSTDSAQPAQWTFEVADTGPGIPPAQQQRIFEAFHQEEGAHRHEGSGLGLAITRQLCRQLGGDVEVLSQPRAGSKFTATLLAAVAQPSSLPGRATREAPAAIPSGLRALVVDDHPLNARLTGLLLKRSGCTTTVVYDAAAAIAACSAQTFDIVFMDIEMPNIDGLQATRELRRLESEGRLAGLAPLYIVALTGHVLPESQLASLEAGMNDHLEKPLKPAELQRALAAMQAEDATAFDCKDLPAA